MKLKITIPSRTVEIDRCYHTCPHFGSGPVMCCQHPFWDDKGAYAGCIISHPECDDGFPSQCPLLQENGISPPKVKNEKSNREYLTEEERFERRFADAFAREIEKEKSS